MDRRYLIAIIVFCIIWAGGIVFAVLRSNRSNKDEDFAVRKKKVKNKGKGLIGSSGYVKIAHFFAKLPLTRKLYARVRSTVAALNPANNREVEAETGKVLLKAVGSGLLVFIVNIILNFTAGFSIFYLCAGVFAAFVIIKGSLTSTIRTIKKNLLEEEQAAFSSIRHNYHTTNAVDSAINLTIGSTNGSMASHLSEIYRIVTSANMDVESAKYIAKRPDRYLLMFLSICTATKEFGDTILENGMSLFNKNVAFLKEEVENEILALKRQIEAFKGLEIWTLVPLFGIKPLEAWAKSNIPQIAEYYTGIFSSAALVFTFLVTYIIYSAIQAMQEGTDDIVSQENSIWSRIAAVPAISKWLNRHISGPKYTYYKNLDSKMRGIGDHTGTRAFIIKRVGFGIIGFVAMFAVFIVGTYSGKKGMLKDFSKDFEESIQLTDEYKAQMRDTATLLVEENINKKAEEIDIKEELKETYGFNDVAAGEVEEAIKQHVSEYKLKYFKWWQFIISVLAGFGLSFLPLAVIAINSPLIDAKRQEEVMQFQTLMLILMHIPSMDVSKILEWMGRFSSVFTENIVRARAKLGSGMKKALVEMKESEVYQPFRDFVDNLLAIDEIGIADAFDEVVSDHEYYMETKKIEKEASIARKAGRAKFLANIPLYVVLVLYLFVPMIRYALKMLEASSTTTGL